MFWRQVQPVENGEVSEYRLRGGSVSTVVRAGDTVRRRPGGRFVHELLGAVREVRAAFVPRGQPHRFTVSATGPARALVITGPSRLAAQIAERGEAVPPDLGL